MIQSFTITFTVGVIFIKPMYFLIVHKRTFLVSQQCDYLKHQLIYDMLCILIHKSVWEIHPIHVYILDSIYIQRIVGVCVFYRSLDQEGMPKL